MKPSHYTANRQSEPQHPASSRKNCLTLQLNPAHKRSHLSFGGGPTPNLRRQYFETLHDYPTLRQGKSWVYDRQQGEFDNMVRAKTHRLADPLPDSTVYAPESTPELTRYARYHQSIKMAHLAMLQQPALLHNQQWDRQHSLRAGQRNKLARSKENFATTANHCQQGAQKSKLRATTPDAKHSQNWIFADAGPELSSGSLSKKNVTVIPVDTGPRQIDQKSGKGSKSGSVRTGVSTFDSHDYGLSNILKPMAPYRKPVFEVFPKIKMATNHETCDDHCCCCAPKFNSRNRSSQGSYDRVPNDGLNDQIYESLDLPLPPAELLQDTSPEEPVPPANFERTNEVPCLAALSLTSAARDGAKQSPNNEYEVDSGRFSAQGTVQTGSNSNHDSYDSTSVHTSSNSSSRSCPDLSSPIDLALNKDCDNCDDKGTSEVEHETGNAPNSSKCSATKDRWKNLPLRDWQHTDLLQFLHASNIDDAATILIGYEFCGQDIIEWDDGNLLEFGILDPKVRRKLLRRLESVKAGETQPLSKQRTERKTSAHQKSQPLFNLVRAASFDQIIAVETRLSTVGKVPVNISVAETSGAGLQVTKAVWPLKLGDWDFPRTLPILLQRSLPPSKHQSSILEVNSIQTQSMAAVDFNQILLRNTGNPLRFVVLRKKHESTESNRNSTDGEDGRNALTPESEFAVMHF